MVQLSPQTIDALTLMITGDGDHSGYRRGLDLVDFFNQFGFEDTYGPGFPSRQDYTKEKLRQLNGTEKIEDVLCASVDPRDFLGTSLSEEAAVDHLNSFLLYDGIQLIKKHLHYRIEQKISYERTLEVVIGNDSVDKISHEFIDQQIRKCSAKIESKDYDGAITNARSLVEAILREMEIRLSEEPPSTDGDLNKQYKRVRKLLNLEPKTKNLDATLVEILRGLISIVNGISSLRNSASDAHARRYKTEKHHATLAVNSAYTIGDFLFETYRHQERLGLLPTALHREHS